MIEVCLVHTAHDEDLRGIAHKNQFGNPNRSAKGPRMINDGQCE